MASLIALLACVIPLCVAFVDYDSVQTQAKLTSLQEQGIEDVYIEILKDIYTDSSVTVHEQREWENQDQERSKTGGLHLTQAVHGNNGEHNI